MAEEGRHDSLSSVEVAEELHLDAISPLRNIATKIKAKTTAAAGNIVNTVAPIATAIVPQYELLRPVIFVLLTFACIVPVVLFIIGFTKMGYGVKTQAFLLDRVEPHTRLIGGLLAGFTSLVYLLDATYWKSPIGKFMRRSLYVFMIIGTASLLLAISQQHPYGPTGVFLVVLALWLLYINHIFFRDMPTRTYVGWLAEPLFCTSVLTFLAWFIWTFWRDENEFTDVTKLIDADAIGCVPDFNNPDISANLDRCKGTNKGGVCFSQTGSNSILYPDGCDQTCRKVYASCLNPFIIWAGPFLVSISLLFLSFFTTFIKAGVAAEEEISKFVKVWLFILIGLWVSASLAGVTGGLSFALAGITLSAFVASGIFLYTSFSRMEREEQIVNLWKTVSEKYGPYLNGARGLLVVTCAPIAFAYFFVSLFKQTIRSCRCFKCSEPPQSTRDLAELNGFKWLTVESRKAIVEFRSWDRVSVYSWAVFWGFIFMTYNVIISRFTVLFLSWLISVTRDLALGTVTGIMIGVGVIMFLLPPVPGAPIYLTLGIVMIPAGSKTLGLVGSILYAIGVSLFLKLLATALQQKAIGGLLKNKVGVRQLVGVNSPLIRGGKLLLEKPGLGIGKVSILVGGPDWPTSVLCGIIGLPLFPILIGTLPVIALIIPTVLAGSFTFLIGKIDDRGIPEYPRAQLWATLFSALAAAVLLGSGALATYYVGQTLSNRGDELDMVPLDEEVKNKEDEEEALRKVYVEVTNWKKVPLVMKIMLTLSVALMIVSAYIVQLFSTMSFEAYALTDTIEDRLSGDWKNLVRPLGWYSILVFTICLLLFSVFYYWAKNKANAKLSNADDMNANDTNADEMSVPAI